MLKRYLYAVVAETQEAAENRLREEGYIKPYLLTTEPYTDPLRKIKEAQRDAQEDYKAMSAGDSILRAYKEGYMDAINDLVKELGL